MIHVRILSCLILVQAWSWSLETPLVMPQAGSGSMVALANPQLGSLRAYRGGGRSFNLIDDNNIYTDLFFYANIPHPQVRNYSLLRVGKNTEPNYGDTLGLLKQKRSRGADEKAANLFNAAVRGEDTYWSEAPRYNGVLRGAFGSTALFVVVPSMRAIMVYTLRNNQLELSAWRNIGPDLYLPGFNTKPDPSDLLGNLPDEEQERYRTIFAERQEMQAANPDTGLELQDIDPWVIASGSNTFIVVEPNNSRILTYRVENNTLVLRASRNIEIDLMVPPEATFGSEPTPKTLYEIYERSMKKAKRTPYTPTELRALAKTTALDDVEIETEETGIQGALDNKGYLILDFTNLSKLLVYNPDEGGRGIILYAARDYSLEAGIGIHEEQIKRQHLGTQAYQQVVRMARGAKPEELPGIMTMLKVALSYNPFLYEEAEGEKIFRREKLNEQAEWGPMIEKALARVEAAKAEEAQRQQLLEEWEENQEK